METKTSGRIWKVIVVILAVMLAAGIAVSCALGAMALSRMGEQGGADRPAQQDGDQPDEHEQRHSDSGG